MEGYRINSKEQFLNQILKCSEEELSNHINNKTTAYNKYSKKKKSGTRIIYAVTKTNPIYYHQNDLKSIFFRTFLFPESVCGFRKGKSYYNFLMPHISRTRSRFFLRLDISDFFGSIRIEDLNILKLHRQKNLLLFFIQTHLLCIRRLVRLTMMI